MVRIRRHGPLRPAVPVVVLAFVLLSPSWLTAQDQQAATAGDQTPSPWYRALSFNCFLSASYSYNFNKPLAGLNQYRVFDTADRTFRIDALELVVQKAAKKSGDLGFRVDAMVGSAVPPVVASAGLFRDRAGNAHNYDVHQAYVNYIVPLGTGLRVDVGKFVTHTGYEVIEGYDGYNDNFTHSFLFGYAIPYAHTGVRATYALSGGVSGTLLVTNGWDVVRDNNHSLSLGAQVSITVNPKVNVLLNYIGGPEASGNNADARRVYDLVTTWKVSDHVNAAVNATYGTEANFPVASGKRDVTWAAAAGYLRYTLTPKLAFVLRAESFGDPDGARTGVAQHLYSVTVTPEIKPLRHLVVRADLRLDGSNADVFERRTGFTRHQATIAVNVISVF